MSGKRIFLDLPAILMQIAGSWAARGKSDDGPEFPQMDDFSFDNAAGNASSSQRMQGLYGLFFLQPEIGAGTA